MMSRATRERRRSRASRCTEVTRPDTLPSWWNPEVNAAWRVKRRALEEWHAAKHGPDAERGDARAARNRADALFRRSAAAAKREKWDMLSNQANLSSTSFWRFVRDMCGNRSAQSHLQIQDGDRSLRTDEERGKAFLSRFLQQCGHSDMDARRAAIDDLSASTASLSPPRFSEADLNRAIAGLGKIAPGPDGLTPETFNGLCRTDRKKLLSELNSSVLTGVIPAEWLDSFLVPIPKPGKNHRELKGYRIIAVQNIFGKLAEHLVARLLTQQLEVALPSTLGAYRPGRATWTNAGAATSFISEAFEARESALAVGLDIEDAYNAVQLPKLVCALLRLGVNPHLVRWVAVALRSRRCSMRCGRWSSPWVDVATALPQGSPISPVCFNAYTEPLASLQVPDGAAVLTFADDMLILTRAREASELVRRTQAILDQISNTCDIIGLRINPDKAEACIFTRSSPDVAIEVNFGGRVIPLQPSLTHLGVVLDKQLRGSLHLEKAVSKAQRGVNTLKVAAGLGIDHRNLMCLYRSLVLSRLLYGFEVFCFSNNQLRPAEVVQNGAMRVVTGCTKDTSISALRYMLQLPTVAQQHQLNQTLGVSKALQRPTHPLHDIVCRFTDRAPRKRLTRTSWVRSACESLRGIRGRHSLRHDDGWVPVSQEVLHSWRFLVHHLGAECRDWPSGEANAEIERLLDELGANRPDSVVVATDGSVSRVPPRTGWGAVLRAEGRTLQTYSGGTRLALSSLRAEMEAVTRAFEMTDGLNPAPRSLFVLTDSQSLLRRLESGLCPPEWLQRARQITWIYCPGHSGVVVNEHADRLAGKTSEVSGRICLGLKDISTIIKN